MTSIHRNARNDSLHVACRTVADATARGTLAATFTASHIGMLVLQLDTKVLYICDAAGTLTEYTGGSLVTQFIQLTDAPGSFAGQGGKYVAVKSDVSGLEFVEAAGGGSALICDGITKTVGASGKDFTTITDAIDWFKGKILTGDPSEIVVDAGTYTMDEYDVPRGCIWGEPEMLTITGDTRAGVGVTVVPNRIIEAPLVGGVRNSNMFPDVRCLKFVGFKFLGDYQNSIWMSAVDAHLVLEGCVGPEDNLSNDGHYGGFHIAMSTLELKDSYTGCELERSARLHLSGTIYGQISASKGCIITAAKPSTTISLCGGASQPALSLIENCACMIDEPSIMYLHNSRVGMYLRHRSYATCATYASNSLYDEDVDGSSFVYYGQNAGL